MTEQSKSPTVEAGGVLTPVARDLLLRIKFWMAGIGEIAYVGFQRDSLDKLSREVDAFLDRPTPAAAADTVPLADYQALQRLVTSQGIRLMDAKDAASPAAAAAAGMSTSAGNCLQTSPAGHEMSTRAGAGNERQHHAALQRIGYALGLLPGTDLHEQCVPAIQALKRAALIQGATSLNQGFASPAAAAGVPTLTDAMIEAAHALDPCMPRDDVRAMLEAALLTAAWQYRLRRPDGSCTDWSGPKAGPCLHETGQELSAGWVYEVRTALASPVAPAGALTEDTVPMSVLVEQRRRMGAEYDELHAELQRVREVARAALLSAGAPAQEPTQTDAHRLSVLASFAHEVWMGVYEDDDATAIEHAKRALERTGLTLLTDVVRLAAPRNDEDSSSAVSGAAISDEGKAPLIRPNELNFPKTCAMCGGPWFINHECNRDAK